MRPNFQDELILLEKRMANRIEEAKQRIAREVVAELRRTLFWNAFWILVWLLVVAVLVRC